LLKTLVAVLPTRKDLRGAIIAFYILFD